ncbi:MAG: signal peptidase I [Kiritimatiellae bacterium]|nr:signal peptidase I [Kiritimatiellia bacterium]
MNVKDWLIVRRAKRDLKNLRNDYRLYVDLLSPEVCEQLEVRFLDAAQAIRGKEVEDLAGVIATLQMELTAALPKKRCPWLTEALDVVISALAVAFCFRAYYYEPFRIPTGSMQPTLYGIHSIAADRPTVWDKQPLKFLKWCATGTSWKDVTIQRGGVVSGFVPSANPGYVALIVNGRDAYELPDDAAQSLRFTLLPGQRVRTGQRIWSGYVTSGDFLFVNRWLWNFRHPQLGETIVFSTQGLKGLPDNQHYIKRLCGRPGDKVELREDSPWLWVNGSPAEKPSRLAEIAEKQVAYPGAPAYLGYQVAHPGGQYAETFSTFDLGVGEYLALGDNTGNSLDSRYWGKVPSRNLLGPASFVHWPIVSPRWGAIR